MYSILKNVPCALGKYFLLLVDGMSYMFSMSSWLNGSFISYNIHNDYLSISYINSYQYVIWEQFDLRFYKVKVKKKKKKAAFLFCSHIIVDTVITFPKVNSYKILIWWDAPWKQYLLVPNGYGTSGQLEYIWTHKRLFNLIALSWLKFIWPQHHFYTYY